MAARLQCLICLLTLVAILAVSGKVSLAADDVPGQGAIKSFFRIGTSPVGESHFLIGGILANALSNPAGSRSCAKGGSCGIPSMIAAAQSSNGSVENLERLRAGTLDAALLQDDIAVEAFQGTGIFKGRPPMDELRLLAFLYYDSLQIVTRHEAGIRTLADLRNKRIGIGEKGSDAYFTAKIVLDAAGIGLKNVRDETLPLDQAVAKLAGADLDALFVVDGYPAWVIRMLDRNISVSLVPLGAPARQAIRERHPFFAETLIPADVYSGNKSPVESMRVGVHLFATAALSDVMVCGISQALHHPSTKANLLKGHWRGKDTFPVMDTIALPVPLHPGLEKCKTDH